SRLSARRCFAGCASEPRARRHDRSLHARSELRRVGLPFVAPTARGPRHRRRSDRARAHGGQHPRGVRRRSRYHVARARGPSDGGAHPRDWSAAVTHAAGAALAMSPPVRRRLVVGIASFGALLIVSCLVAPLVGSTSISLRRAFDPALPFADNVDAQIFFIARLPRVLAAVVVGASLAAAGVVFQALLRNPLA